MKKEIKLILLGVIFLAIGFAMVGLGIMISQHANYPDFTRDFCTGLFVWAGVSITFISLFFLIFVNGLALTIHVVSEKYVKLNAESNPDSDDTVLIIRIL